MKQFQNKIAESRLALPAASLYALAVWLLCGLLTQHWWVQFGCFAVATYLMVELNNINALIRIYSRMVSCTFVALSCCACFLFPSLLGAIMQICVIGTFMLLFATYQDKASVGMTYYAFTVLGICSMTFVHVVYYLPLLWILMATHLQSLSWRTWGASILGLLTPYWFASCWLIWHEDFSLLADHFTQLAVFQFPIRHLSLSPSQIAFFALLLLLFVVSSVHNIRQQNLDKIRIRLLYGVLIWTGLLTVVFILFQPQHYNSLIRIMIICTAPLAAHFIALTHTKLTNIFFCAITAITLLLTIYNVWMSSSLF